MTILVTGAGGQVGAELLRRSGTRPMVALARQDLDITTAAAVRAAFARIKPRLVINAAAFTAVDAAQRQPEQAYAVNRDGTACLAEACRAAGLPLFHLSTDHVFDGHGSRDYREDDPASPLNVYGASKQAGEQAIRRRLPQHLIIRTSWVFGAHGGGFVQAILRQARYRQALSVVADQVGAPTYAGAIADSLLQLADRHLQEKTLRWGTYHYCGHPSINRHAFAEVICEEGVAAGLLERVPQIHAAATVEEPGVAPRPRYAVLDTRLGQECLQLRPSAWRQGLREMLTIGAKA